MAPVTMPMVINGKPMVSDLYARSSIDSSGGKLWNHARASRFQFTLLQQVQQACGEGQEESRITEHDHTDMQVQPRRPQCLRHSPCCRAAIKCRRHHQHENQWEHQYTE